MTPEQQPDELERLIEAAQHPELDVGLAPEEGGAVMELRQTLSAIDASWQPVDATAYDRLRAITLAKLRARGARHVWGSVDTVATLGDLVRTNDDLRDALPAAALTSLETDSTPVGELLRDPEARQQALRASFERAAVPAPSASTVFRRILQALSELIPAPTAGGMVYARPQKRQPKSTREGGGDGSEPAAGD